MAKETKTIVRAVRTGGEDGKVYKPGQEDELAAVLTASQGKRLVENGSLEGEWGTAKAADAPKSPAK